MNIGALTNGFMALRGQYGPWAGGCLLLMSVLLPIWPGASWAMAIVAFVLAIVRGLRERTARWHADGVGSPVIWAIAFYLLHVIGLLWTSDLGFAFFDLDIKSPLLLFALFAAYAPPGPSGRDALCFAFVAGAVISVLGHVCAAFLRMLISDQTHAVAELYSSSFSTPIHPSYLALYVCAAIAVLYLTRLHATVAAWASAALLLVLCGGVVLCGSKAGWIVMVLLLPFLVIARWKDARTRSVLAGSVLVSGVLAGALLALLPNARERLVEAWHAATEDTHAVDASSSSEARWVTWSAAWTLFAEHPLTGTGTGDIKNELLRVYAERGNTHALERRYNAHDQFLQSAACLGVAGFVALLALVLLPVILAKRMGRLAAVVALIWVVNLLVESMLEVQAGTEFMGFTLLVLFAGKRTDPTA